MHGLRELAERTPPRQERHVDLLWTLTMLIVALGHAMLPRKGLHHLADKDSPIVHLMPD